MDDKSGEKSDLEKLIRLEKAVFLAWDMIRRNNFGTPLEYNALKFLGASKLELGTWLKNNAPLKEDNA